MPRPKGSPKTGGRTKGTPNRRTAVKRRAEARALQQAEITAERTILELGRLAFTDRRRVWKDGQLQPLDAWTADEAACLEGFEVIVKNAAAGDGHTDTVHKVRLATKHHALETLAKHFGLLKDVVEHRGSVELLQRLDAGRQRAAGR